MSDKNIEREKNKKKIQNLNDQKKKFNSDVERKKLLIKKKEMISKEKELKKMEHLKSFRDFIT